MQDCVTHIKIEYEEQIHGNEDFDAELNWIIYMFLGLCSCFCFFGNNTQRERERETVV